MLVALQKQNVHATAKLTEQGFDYATDIDKVKLFRKRKRLC
jgi:hypothetical protein